jgi:hypothetical protein
MSKTERVKKRQADLVIPSHLMSTVIQQGTIALREIVTMRKNHL